MLSVRHFLILAAVAVLASAAQGVTVLYVDDDAPPGGDGLGWDSAFRFLQDALAVGGPAPDVNVRVAQGTYQPDRSEAHPEGTRNRDASFLVLPSVRIDGGYAGLGADRPDENDPARFLTVLSGDLDGDDGPDFANRDDNARHVVVGSGFSHIDERIMTGLVIEGGNADGTGLSGQGGGIYTNAELHVSHCVIRDNQATSGGGAYVAGTYHIWTFCTFSGNAATRGGGMYMQAVLFQLSSATFHSNVAFQGGGLYHTSSGGNHVDGCTFEGNAAVEGGGIYNTGTGLMRMSMCSILRNTAERGGGAYNRALAVITRCSFLANAASVDGGAMYDWLNAPPYDVSISVTSCRFVGNVAAARGGGLFTRSGAHETANNCSFVANAAGQDGGSTFADSGQIQIANCILWNNVPNQIGTASGVIPLVDFSDLEAGWAAPGSNSIDADPRFVAAPGPGPDRQWGTDDDDLGDLHLQADSPCIDAGNNWGVSDDYDDLDHDQEVDELVPQDLAGFPRFANGPADEPGCGVPVIVDMGAYEFPGASVGDIYRADSDGNGTVGISDLLTLLADWGPCDAPCCLSDLNLDGKVDLSDFVILLGEWK